MIEMKLINTDMSMYGRDIYHPKINPLVITNENGIYSELRKSLISQMEKSNQTPSGVFDGLREEAINPHYRSSSFCTIDKKLYDAVKNRLDYVVDWQMSQQSDSQQYNLAENLQFLRYSSSEDGHFKAHTDNAYFDLNGVFQYTSPQRVLASISYLNDDFEGGEISFPNIIKDDGNILVVTPKPGMTILFPADMRYPHEVHPITKGSRYCIVAWYNTK